MAQLSINLLGSFQVQREGAQVTRFRGDKVRALLAYLAVEGDQPFARSVLAGLLWPEQGDTQALRNLSQALLRLSEALGGLPLRVSRQAIQWQPDAAEVDTRAFEQLARSSETADLAQAAVLYRGELLAGFSLPDCEAFEEWLLLARERLLQQALAALDTLTEQHLAAGRLSHAATTARRQVELDSWREQAHRQLMRALALGGDRGAALAQYAACCQALEAGLGVEPDVETRSLYEQIRTNELRIENAELRTASNDQEQSSILNSQFSIQHNLPALLTPFVGREAELAELAALRAQPDTRLLTLVGAGGMGKTRLALQIARGSLEAHADGVFFVSLASLATGPELPAAIAQALDLSLHGDPATALLHFLRNKQLLLILDNFEHLLDGADLVVALLQEAPQLQIIATSRARLNLRGEQIYIVQGLDYTADAKGARAATSAAVRLFAQAARRAEPRFQVGEANLPEVLRICALVHGMPLGLELAAAWTEMLPLAEIAQEIERSADFLAADWADAPERQRSMRAVFDWSWQLLNDAERQALRELSVFRGPFTREAAEVVVGASLRVLTRLMHKSLLRWNEAGSIGGRYDIHELLRQFAAEQLHASGERAVVEARHGEYYLHFVAERERRLARSEPREAAAEIRAEIDNVRQAWIWAASRAYIQALDRAAYSVWQFYTLTGLWSDGERPFVFAIERLQAYLEQAGQSTAEICSAHRTLSKLLALHTFPLIAQNKFDQAIRQAQHAIALAEASGGMEGETLAYQSWGQALCRKAQYTEARPLFERALLLARTYLDQDPSSEALHEIEWVPHVWLRAICLVQGDSDGARTHVVLALRICQQLGKVRGETICLGNLALTVMSQADYTSARRYYEQALLIAQRIGYRWAEGVIQLELGNAARCQGEYALARDLLERALPILHEIGDGYQQAFAIIGLSRLHTYLGDYVRSQAWLDQLPDLICRIAVPEAEWAELCARAVHAYYAGDAAQALEYAEQAWRNAHELSDRFAQAETAIVLGHALARLNRLAEAIAAYQHALTLFDLPRATHLVAEAWAGLASVALVQGQLAQAQGYTEDILQAVAVLPHAGLDEPFFIYFTCYRVLETNGDPRAAAVLRDAARLLHEYATHIADDALRRSFLEIVATHRAILEAAGTAHTLTPQPS